MLLCPSSPSRLCLFFVSIPVSPVSRVVALIVTILRASFVVFVHRRVKAKDGLRATACLWIYNMLKTDHPRTSDFLFAVNSSPLLSPLLHECLTGSSGLGKCHLAFRGVQRDTMNEILGSSGKQMRSNAQPAVRGGHEHPWDTEWCRQGFWRTI